MTCGLSTGSMEAANVACTRCDRHKSELASRGYPCAVLWAGKFNINLVIDTAVPEDEAWLESGGQLVVLKT